MNPIVSGQWACQLIGNVSLIVIPKCWLPHTQTESTGVYRCGLGVSSPNRQPSMSNWTSSHIGSCPAFGSEAVAGESEPVARVMHGVAFSFHLLPIHSGPALLLDGPHLRHHVVRTCRVGALRVRPVGGRDEETNEKVGLTWVPGGSSHTESEEVFGGEVILARLAH